MTVTTEDFTQEKSELESVLGSGIFDRSPSLAHLLTYVCQKHFEGTADQIKEYNIAVDVLGRPIDFDQKRDSIVRVHFHRLRNRLAAYYAKDGSARPLRIIIPQGQYVPRFIPSTAGEVVSGRQNDTTSATSMSNEPTLLKSLGDAPELADIPAAPARASASRWIIAAALLTLVAAAGLMFAIRRSTAPPAFAQPSKPSQSPAFVGTDSIRILCGLKTGAFTDGFGHVWQRDDYFDGGTVTDLPGLAILGTREPRLFQSRRQGQFRYDIPAAPGDYEVRLYFAETFFGETNTAGYGGEASRAFSIQINGKTVRNRLDVVGEVGSSTANIKVYRDVNPANDGRIHISFGLIVGVPFLNAIEITPGTPGQLRPIRIVAQQRGYTDVHGQYWEPDRYATGGVMVARTQPPDSAPDPGLWAGERFGNLTYRIPAPPSSYTVKLYMSERWLGPGLPGGGGAGSRLFDILCNGVVLERDFDLFKRAGGADRAFVYTMRGMKTNHQDQLVISLEPSKNFPLVNAIEVLDEARSSRS